ARSTARDVPATRLPLDRLPQAAGKPDVVPEMPRARREERRQRKEAAFDGVQHRRARIERRAEQSVGGGAQGRKLAGGHGVCRAAADGAGDRKSTRLNSSHGSTSHAAFCLNNKKTQQAPAHDIATSSRRHTKLTD